MRREGGSRLAPTSARVMKLLAAPLVAMVAAVRSSPPQATGLGSSRAFVALAVLVVSLFGRARSPLSRDKKTTVSRGAEPIRPTANKHMLELDPRVNRKSRPLSDDDESIRSPRFQTGSELLREKTQVEVQAGMLIAREHYKFQNPLLPETCWSQYLFYVWKGLHRQPRVGSPQPQKKYGGRLGCGTYANEPYNRFLYLIYSDGLRPKDRHTELRSLNSKGGKRHGTLAVACGEQRPARDAAPYG